MSSWLGLATESAWPLLQRPDWARIQDGTHMLLEVQLVMLTETPPFSFQWTFHVTWDSHRVPRVNITQHHFYYMLLPKYVTVSRGREKDSTSSRSITLSKYIYPYIWKKNKSKILLLRQSSHCLWSTFPWLTQSQKRPKKLTHCFWIFFKAGTEWEFLKLPILESNFEGA